jgi:DNA repair photolyase
MRNILGELYEPRGKALETARAVLEVDKVYAVNVAWGCNNCSYCYNRRLTKGKITYPKKPPFYLVKKQLESGIIPEGVFMCFGCDPYMPENTRSTWNVIKLLLEYKIIVATLSKMDLLNVQTSRIRHGMTVVSLSKEFSRREEKGAIPPSARIKKLRDAYNQGLYVWGSLEPAPCPAKYKQEIRPLLEKLSFVHFLILGKWNYEPLCQTPEAHKFYLELADEFIDFCKDHAIRYHVKKEIMQKQLGA